MLSSTLLLDEKNGSTKRPLTPENLSLNDTAKKPKTSLSDSKNSYDAFPMLLLEVENRSLAVICLNEEKDSATRQYFFDLSKLLDAMGCGPRNAARWAAAQLKPKKCLPALDDKHLRMLKWDKRQTHGARCNQKTRCLLITRENLHRLPHRSEHQRNFIASLLFMLEATNILSPATITPPVKTPAKPLQVESKSIAIDVEIKKEEVKPSQPPVIEAVAETKFPFKTMPCFNVPAHVIASLPAVSKTPQSFFSHSVTPHSPDRSTQDDDFVNSLLM